MRSDAFQDRPCRAGSVSAARTPSRRSTAQQRTAHLAPSAAARSRAASSRFGSARVLRTATSSIGPRFEVWSSWACAVGESAGARRSRGHQPVTHPKELPLASLQSMPRALPVQLPAGRNGAIASRDAEPLIHADAYSGRVANGFRRSGMFTYRPYCDGCRAACRCACPSRASCRRAASAAPRARDGHPPRACCACASRRALPALPALSGRPPHRRLQDQDSIDHYTQFLRKAASTRAGRIPRASPMASARSDGVDPRRAERRLSAVYTFFEPEPKTSYGTYNVLGRSSRRVARLPAMSHRGYWIDGSGKMAYKAQFGPHEVLIGGDCVLPRRKGLRPWTSTSRARSGSSASRCT